MIVAIGDGTSNAAGARGLQSAHRANGERIAGESGVSVALAHELESGYRCIGDQRSRQRGEPIRRQQDRVGNFSGQRYGVDPRKDLVDIAGHLDGGLGRPQRR